MACETCPFAGGCSGHRSGGAFDPRPANTTPGSESDAPPVCAGTGAHVQLLPVSDEDSDVGNGRAARAHNSAALASLSSDQVGAVRGVSPPRICRRLSPDVLVVFLI